MGISFTVYSDGENIDRAWPFDIIPRIIDGNEWSVVEQGLAQRLRALNRFIDDVYNDQRIVADGVFPAELLADSANYRCRVPGHPSEVRCVGAHLRFRSRASRRRPAVRAGGQPAGAVGRELRAREPGHREAGVPGTLPAVPDPSRRRLHRRAQQAAVVARSRRSSRSHHRRAHARHLQLRLLRALVPRPADGRRTRRRPGSRRRRRRLRVHEDDPGVRTCRRDLPAHRRPLPRPRGVPAPNRHSGWRA